ncbi:MAG: (2Fe-2S)-binding protein [Myxococcales bacterium]|nr:(2Fe-2S)-binding protein [Myxococcales bacterium]
MSDNMVTVHIDGEPVQVPGDTTVFHACEKAGKQPPHFCYHPALGVDGNCRMCMVKIEGMPKPQISCDLRVKDGMKVDTESEDVKRIRSGVLELILVNHPIDCPICDQSGECKLQDFYMEAGLHKSMVPLSMKVHKPKVQDIGGDIVLDAERCVACSRCVRFCNNVTQTGELALFNRGDHTEIGTHPGVALDNDYTGCLADICPVGALTSKDFRFKCRVWFLSRTESVCPGCATGCNIEIDHHEGKIQRLKPRVNEQVNGYWMCDAGRFGYKDVHAPTRLKRFEARAGAERVAEPAKIGLEKIAHALRNVRRDRGAGSIAALASAAHTVEELFLFRKLIEEAVGATEIGLVPTAAGEADNLLIHEDKNPNTTGAMLLGYNADGVEKILARVADGSLKALIVLGADLTTLPPSIPAGLGAKALEAAELVVFLGTHANGTAQAADYVAPLASYAETHGTFVNYKGRVQRIQPAVRAPGDADAGWRVLQDLHGLLVDAARLESAAEVFGQVAAAYAPFKGMDYETLGLEGKVIAK